MRNVRVWSHFRSVLRSLTPNVCIFYKSRTTLKWRSLIIYRTYFLYLLHQSPSHSSKEKINHYTLLRATIFKGHPNCSVSFNVYLSSIVLPSAVGVKTMGMLQGLEQLCGPYISTLGRFGVWLLHVLFLMKLSPSHCYAFRHDLLFSAVWFEISKSDLVHMSKDYFNNGYGPMRVLTLRLCVSHVLLQFGTNKDTEGSLFSSSHCIQVSPKQEPVWRRGRIRPPWRGES
jgi:hypothetical protein